MPAKKLRITLTKSIIGLSPKQEATVKALGLRRMHQSVSHDDTPTVRVHAVSESAKAKIEAKGGRVEVVE